jgi:hypothetical protein
MRSPPLLPALRLSAILLLAPAIMVADEVHLADGRVVDGDLRPAPGGGWDLTVRQGDMVATHHLSPTDVVRVVHGPTRTETERAAIIAERQLLGVAAAPESLWRLAARARQVGDPSLARSLAEEVVDRERHHTEARKFLGFHMQQGVWMKPAEAATARGEIYHNGRWMTWLQREEYIAAEAQRIATIKAEQEAQAKERAALRAATEAAEAAEAARMPVLGFSQQSNNCQTRQPWIVTYPGWPAPWPQQPAYDPMLRLRLQGGTSWLQWNFNWNL